MSAKEFEFTLTPKEDLAPPQPDDNKWNGLTMGLSFVIKARNEKEATRIMLDELQEEYPQASADDFAIDVDVYH